MVAPRCSSVQQAIAVVREGWAMGVWIENVARVSETYKVCGRVAETCRVVREAPMGNVGCRWQDKARRNAQ